MPAVASSTSTGNSQRARPSCRLKRIEITSDSAEPTITSVLAKYPSPSVTNMPNRLTWRPRPRVSGAYSTSASVAASAATASHEAARAARSPAKAPNSSSAMAQPPRNISGKAGRKSGAEIMGPSPLGQRAVLALGDLDALDQIGERGLHRPQERGRINPHPQHHRDHRREDQHFARGEIEHGAHVVLGDD